jgi:hypothetical protein
MHISQARPNAGDYVMLGFPRNLALRRLNKKSFKVPRIPQSLFDLFKKPRS